ncbi:unnamed protein product [Caenorhabditis auriculariae]|uniref:beta-N-acetylhexosaminidase n=1 Tax=Caenorhabditis auriculariae TaxID=2777116 RepID=A0A8S1GUG0_9PELO|nr:unnamed protein product [Caenorhabditis auriculariae]
MDIAPINFTTLSQLFSPTKIVVTYSGDGASFSFFQHALTSYFSRTPLAWKRKSETFPTLLTFPLSFVPFEERLCFGPHVTPENVARIGFLHMFIIKVATTEEYRTAVRHHVSEWFAKVNSKSDVQWLIIVDTSHVKEKKSRTAIMDKIKADFNKNHNRLMEVFDSAEHSSFTALLKSVQQAIFHHIDLITVMWERSLQSCCEKNKDIHFNAAEYAYSTVNYAKLYWSLAAVEHAASIINNLEMFIQSAAEDAYSPWLQEMAGYECSRFHSLFDDDGGDNPNQGKARPLDLIGFRTFVLKQEMLLCAHMYQKKLNSNDAAPSLRSDCAVSILTHALRSLSWLSKCSELFEMKSKDKVACWSWRMVAEAVVIASSLIDVTHLESALVLLSNLYKYRCDAVLTILKTSFGDVQMFDRLHQWLKADGSSFAKQFAKVLSCSESLDAEMHKSYDLCVNAMLACNRTRLAISTLYKLHRFYMSIGKPFLSLKQVLVNFDINSAVCSQNPFFAEILRDLCAQENEEVFIPCLFVEKCQSEESVRNFLKAPSAPSSARSSITKSILHNLTLQLLRVSPVIPFSADSEIILTAAVRSNLSFKLSGAQLILRMGSPPICSPLQKRNKTTLEVTMSDHDGSCRLLPLAKSLAKDAQEADRRFFNIVFGPFDIAPSTSGEMKLSGKMPSRGCFSIDEAILTCFNAELEIPLSCIDVRFPPVVFVPCFPHRVSILSGQEPYISGALEQLRLQLDPSFPIGKSSLLLSSPCPNFKFLNRATKTWERTLQCEVDEFQTAESTTLNVFFCLEMDSAMCESVAVQKKSVNIEWMKKSHSFLLPFVPILVINSKTSMLQTNVLLEMEMHRRAGKQWTVEIQQLTLSATETTDEKRPLESLSSIQKKCLFGASYNFVWRLPVKGPFVRHSVEMKYAIRKAVEQQDSEESNTIFALAQEMQYSFIDELEVSVPEVSFEICTQILSQLPGAQLCRAGSLCDCVVSIRCLQEARRTFFVVLDADDRLWNVIDRTKMVTVKDSGLGQLAMSVLPVVAGFLPFPNVSIYECEESKLDAGELLPGKALLCFDRSAGRQIRVLFAANSYNDTDTFTQGASFEWTEHVLLQDRDGPFDFSGESRTNRLYNKVIVHLDLKGAPPVVNYLTLLFPLLREQRVDAVLIEYEDMFPYSGILKNLSRAEHYSRQEISKINEIAWANQIQIVPLIQSFGHLEFVLKHAEFSHLRENPMSETTICPSDANSLKLIEEMILQIKKLHPESTQIHVGADEAYYVAQDKRCVMNMRNRNMTKSELTLRHIAQVGFLAKKAGFQSVFVWNDMFDKEDEGALFNSRIHNFITPVVWGYAEDVSIANYFPSGLFDRISKVFNNFWIASAFKGANGINQTFIDIRRYLKNHKSYTYLLSTIGSKSKSKMAGIIITGWSRFMHGAPLCELFFLSLPSLLTDLLYINNPFESDVVIWRNLKKLLNCTASTSHENLSVAFNENELHNCFFLGSDVYKVIMNDFHSLLLEVSAKSNFTEVREVASRWSNISKSLESTLPQYMYSRDINELADTHKMKEKGGEDSESLLSRRPPASSFRMEGDGMEHDDDDDDFSIWPHVFNLANCIIGVSILAMPYVFQQCGILLATLMVAMCAVLTKYTCHFLVEGSFSTRCSTYESLAFAALGRNGRRLTEACLLFFLFSSIVAFMVVIGDIGPHIVADYLGLEATTQRLRILVMVIVVAFIVIPLSLIENLERFSIISSLAILFYASFVARMVTESVPSLLDGRWSLHIVWWRPEGFLTCLPIVCMAMCCQTQLFPVIACVKKSSMARVDNIVASAINVCSAIYAAVGVFGYVAFYSQELHGDVLVQLEPTLLTQLMKSAFLLSVAVSIPLMLFPARTALFCLLLRPSGCEMATFTIGKATFHVLTAIIVFFNLVLAILVPNVEFILGLTGSFIGTIIATILPSCILLALRFDQNKNRASKRDNTIVAKVCLIAGLIILLTSTWAVLLAENKTNVAEKIKPKQDVAVTIRREDGSNHSIGSTATTTFMRKDSDAVDILEKMKEQHRIQQELIEKQEHIIAELDKHSDLNRSKLDVLVKSSRVSESYVGWITP